MRTGGSCPRYQTSAKQLAAEDSDAKLEAINSIAASGDAAAIPLLKAMQDDALQLFGERLVIVAGSSAKDALTGEAVDAPAEKLTAIVVNNRVRGVLDAALAALKLVSPQREERLAAAKIVASDPDSAMLPLIKTALAKETDAELKTLLELAQALIEIKSEDATARRAAAKVLGESKNSQAKQILTALMQTEFRRQFHRDRCRRARRSSKGH